MLNLREAAALARARLEERISAASKNEKAMMPESAKVIQQSSSFRAHLLDAMKRSGDERRAPSPAPDALFLAFPEKLLGKWHHLAFGQQRQAKDVEIGEVKDIETWRNWDKFGSRTKITNFLSTNTKAVLLAHGLSAIDDSVLLLADIGRSSRAARSMGLPLRVLLADVSWISYNRSLKRFDIEDEAIENGLRSCQARRQRIYEGVGIEVKVHAIVPYQKKGAISAHKIQMIAGHYLQLAADFWGKEKIDTHTPLNNSEVSQIGRPLQSSLSSDSPLQFLASFPGALPALEHALARHLDVIRTIAQRFRILSTDTFSYYFAQYFAQVEYRGTHVKVAPESEIGFDEPYDELDDSFRLWGEGHELSVTPKTMQKGKKRRMAAVYLPQYSIGDWELLPYSPLSLDAVSKSDGKVSAVREKTILLTDCDKKDQPKIETLLRTTLERSGVIQLNRLIADITSFLQCVVTSRGLGAVEAACRRVDGEINDQFSVLHDLLPVSMKIDCEKVSSTSELWLSWLDGIDREKAANYIPCHILIACFTKEDWTDERLRAASIIVLTANRISRDLAI